jgi:hypothetical protein
MTPDEKMEIEKMRAEAMNRQGDIEESEDEIYSAQSPKGRFTSKGANALVEATNRLLPMFGVGDKYDRFSGNMTELPTDFVRLLSMFKAAMDDAIAEGILPEDASIDLTIVTDDSGLQGLAGRIGMAAKSAAFKRFLAKKTMMRGGEEMAKEGEYTEEEKGSEEMDSKGMDKLMMERMS